MDRIELVAKFLEDFSRDEDDDRVIAPTLKRLPKDNKSWQSWIFWAEKLVNLLDKNKASQFT